ncbi:MAG: acyltransferase [Chloroflexota bacterium]
MQSKDKKTVLESNQKLGVRSRLADRTFLDAVSVGFKVLPMFIRGVLTRLFFKQKKGLLLIGKQVSIRNHRHISLSGSLIVEDFAELQGLSKRGIRFGDHVTIGRFAMIRPSGYYGREIGEGLSVGDYSNIGPYSYIGCSGYIEIGNNVLMGPRVGLFAENHNFNKLDLTIREQGVTRHQIIIEDDCWIASGSVITANVCVGTGSIVASGAVVTSDVPPYSIVGGVPAKVIGWRKKENSNG